MKHKRCEIKVVKFDHLAHKYDVISDLVSKRGPALKSCRAASQQRNCLQTPFNLQIRKFVGAPGGEKCGQSALTKGQNVHAKVLARVECRQTSGGVRQAPPYQRRMERYRVEAARGKPNIRPVTFTRRDNCNAGREGAKRMTKAC